MLNIKHLFLIFRFCDSSGIGHTCVFYSLIFTEVGQISPVYNEKKGKAKLLKWKSCYFVKMNSKLECTILNKFASLYQKKIIWSHVLFFCFLFSEIISKKNFFQSAEIFLFNLETRQVSIFHPIWLLQKCFFTISNEKFFWLVE